MSLHRDVQRLAARGQLTVGTRFTRAWLDQWTQPSRQKLHEAMSSMAEAWEEAQDRAAFVAAGLRRGELRWTPQLIPLLLHAGACLNPKPKP
jgi:hypothetical protein